ncbi:MAG: insulinase family protein, partial [Lachnospiraceae bacterium]|nr:insulinase family protein [Lachnospiraceae bacterium]
MFHRYVLSNGIEVISEPMENRKTAALGVFVRVGSQNETKENNGISHLLEHMLFKGTQNHSAKEIADITARMGDDVNAFTSKECTALYGMTVTERMEELAMLLGDMLTASLFEAKELAKEKRIVMDEIDMYQDSAEDLVHELLQKRVWRDDALGYLISGTKSVVRTFRSEQLRRFHQEHYFAENMLISAAGGYEEARMLEWLERAFAGVRRRGAAPGAPEPQQGRGTQKPETPRERKSGPLSPEETAAWIRQEKAGQLSLSTYHKEYERAGGAEHVEKYPEERAGCTVGRRKECADAAGMCAEHAGGCGKERSSAAAPRYWRSFASADREIEQFHINLAFPALCVGDERRFAYSVLNSAFGGSNNSLLFQKIREEAGMAYSVYSYSSAYVRAGLFHIDITVQPQLAVPVLGRAAELAENFARSGLTEEELSLYKQQVETELIMSAESPKTRMDSNAKFALAGAPLYTLEQKLAKIEEITCGDIRQLAAEILQPSVCSVCVAGDRSCAD